MTYTEAEEEPAPGDLCFVVHEDGTVTYFTWGAPDADTVTAAGDFDPDKHPRGGDPEHPGRFSDSEGSGKEEGTFLTRKGADVPVVAPDPAATEAAMEAARGYDPIEPYPHNGSMSPPADWQPGTPAALSESLSTWQHTYADSQAMQIAADSLLGFPSQGTVTPEAAAEARELLTAMSGHGPDGAASAYAPHDDMSVAVASAHVQEYDATELARGVADPRGELLGAFREAQAKGEPVAWSVASFVQGGEPGQQRMDNEMLSGNGTKSDYVWRDPQRGGAAFPLDPDDFAARTALKYTGGKDPLLIRAGGTALNIDGEWEAVAGGKFAVDDIHKSTFDERARWGLDHAVTVVQLHQVENVRPPHEVLTAAAGHMGVSSFIHWRDGSVRNGHLTASGGMVAPPQVVFDFDEAKHPRGGDAEHPGRFSDAEGDAPVIGRDPDSAAARFGGKSLEEMTAGLQRGLPDTVRVVPVKAISDMNHLSRMTWDLKTPEGKGEIQLVSTLDNTARLDLMVIPEGMQGEGVAKTLMANLHDETASMKGMELSANIDVGAYAWAKFGFLPDTCDTLKTSGWATQGGIADRVVGRMNDPTLRDRVSPETRAAVTEIVKDPDPHAMWRLVDTPGTFPLLNGREFNGQDHYDQGVHWHGHLDYGDGQAMERFNGYVHSGQ